jgi:DNA-binding transcriptional ArsR family regulator
VSRTAVSQHLAVLKEAGLVTEWCAGTRRLYRARREGLAALRTLLDEMWATSPDTARGLVESEREQIRSERGHTHDR